MTGKTCRSAGTGSINLGYLRKQRHGTRRLEHIVVAERILGRALPDGAVVHHVDEDRLNNDPTNLVICPSIAYHTLIHQRMRAYAACGHADWRRCNWCKQYDDPANLAVYNGSRAEHKACRKRKRRQLYERGVQSQTVAASGATR